jgi:peptidoglycan hydrolase CwlO-like protein
MLNHTKQSAFFFIVSLAFLFCGCAPVSAQTPTPDNSQQVTDLNNKIRALEAKVSELRSQGNTLSSQIGAMDNQIKLTEYRIDATKKEVMDVTLDIDSATKRMANLEGSLDKVSKTLINRMIATYQMGGTEALHVLLAANDVADLASRANYLRLVQAHDKQLLYDTQQARNDYANQKALLEDKKKKIETLNTQLQQYSTQLDSDKKNKESLLSVTKNDEARYQKLLGEARAQVSAFKSFATSQGGSILPPQASPDGWYYNQRDSRWGNMNIGSSPEPVWEVGCLLTSLAMVMKKHGENVTPSDIAGNSSYFFSNTAYMALPWGGGKFSGGWGYNQSAIDSKLASGEPVVVGVRNGAHFVVLKSGSGGSYLMNDPWNGPDLAFSDYYGAISQYGWYN